MHILLDTCTFIWIIKNDPKLLSSKAKRVYLNKSNALYLSIISFWEIITKYQNGKMYFEISPEEFLVDECFKHNIQLIPLNTDSTLQLTKEPLHHKDPFDRMLICQAKTHNLTILSPDKVFKKYKVKTIW
jgi:PIN domain nuclease of toxin-antitoxin system